MPEVIHDLARFPISRQDGRFVVIVVPPNVQSILEPLRGGKQTSDSSMRTHLSPSLKAVADVQGHADSVERNIEPGR